MGLVVATMKLLSTVKSVENLEMGPTVGQLLQTQLLEIPCCTRPDVSADYVP